MVLKIASDEVQEVRRALSAAHTELLAKLSRVEGCLSHGSGLDLCRRKWTLESMLNQLDHTDDPSPVLEIVAADQQAASRMEAA